MADLSSDKRRLLYHSTLLEIQKLLDGRVWTLATLDEIAEAMRVAGFRIRDIDEVEEDDG
jgi:hypothetical protein